MGAFIGWPITALPTISYCLGTGNGNAGCLLFAAVFGGLPGFVIGGLIGPTIEKPPPQEETAERTAEMGRMVRIASVARERELDRAAEGPR